MTETSPFTAVRGNRQRQRTRKALLTAGEQLFAVKPVESVTIDDIVAAAEVAKGSFYNHFLDKGALADAVFEIVQSDLEAQIASSNVDIADPAMRIARALCTVVRYAREHPERLQALLSLAERRADAGSPLNVGINADLRRGLEAGRLAYFDLPTGILTVVGAINVTVGHALSSALDMPIETLGAAMAASTLRALGVDPKEAAASGGAAARDILGN